MSAMLQRAWRSEARVPALVVLVLVAAKLVLVAPQVVGPTIADEGFYISYARQLLMTGAYDGAHYPPLYPLLISPAMLHWPGFWGVLEVLNAVYSSLSVVFVYLIARELTDRRFASAAAIVSAVVPFHFTLSSAVMSENVFIPLLLAAVWAVVRRPPSRLMAWDVLTGALLGALVLTRYVGIAVIPVLLLAWWLRDDNEAEPRERARVVRLFAVLAGITALVAPWLLVKVGGDGVSLGSALGLGIAGDPQPAQLTTERLLFFAGAYTTYFALVAAPYVSLLAADVWQSWRERSRGPRMRFTVVWVGLTGAFGAALVRHSWRAAYNYPDPVRIMGRYAIPFSLLFMLAAFSGLYRLVRHADPPTTRRMQVAVGAHALVVGGAAQWLMSDARPAGFVTDRGAVDVYRLLLVGWPAIVAAIGIAVGIAYALARRVGTRPLLAGFTAALVAWSLWGMPTYTEQLRGHQRYAEHARRLATVGKTEPGVPVTAFVDPDVVDEMALPPGTRWLGGMHVGSRVWASPWVDVHPAGWQGPLQSGTREMTLVVREDSLPAAVVSYEIDGVHYDILPGR